MAQQAQQVAQPGQSMRPGVERRLPAGCACHAALQAAGLAVLDAPLCFPLAVSLTNRQVEEKALEKEKDKQSKERLGEVSATVQLACLVACHALHSRAGRGWGC